MFESKKELKNSLEELKKELELSFSLENYSKRDLKKLRTALQEAKKQRAKQNGSETMSDIYDRQLKRKINNPDQNSLVKSFGYCYEPSESLYNEHYELICIKYNDSDDWVKIYEYKKGTDDLPIGNGPWESHNYDTVTKLEQLSLKEKQSILSFIEEDEPAMNIFNIYLQKESEAKASKNKSEENSGAKK